MSGARMGAAAGEGGRRRQEGTGPPPRENSHVAGATTQVKILVPGDQSMVALLGQRDVFLKIIESAFDCRILVRGNEITVSGRQEEAEQVARIFEELLALLEKGHDLTDSSVDQTIALVKGAPTSENAKRLIDFLLAPEIEKELIDGHFLAFSVRDSGRKVKAMDVDYVQVAHQMKRATELALSILQDR